ncbi:hypothetical protein NDU88_001785 [Pleurodeles waltl]|uniref:Uncharacterized protein n=1 Tax=Pleurodeles waltl TaxID=8319 RepID=A0AAV7T082_PLEWA|nr:hypothetical protein NDU88_001785 [Pleurodeles waltl]
MIDNRQVKPAVPGCHCAMRCGCNGCVKVRYHTALGQAGAIARETNNPRFSQAHKVVKQKQFRGRKGGLCLAAVSAQQTAHVCLLAGEVRGSR